MFGPLMADDRDLLRSWIRASRKLTPEDTRNALMLIDEYVIENSMRIEIAEEINALAKRSGDEVDVERLRGVIANLSVDLDAGEGAPSVRARLLLIEASLNGIEGNVEGAIRKIEEARHLLESVGAGGESEEYAESEILRRMYHICLNNLASFQLKMDPPETDAALENIDLALRGMPESLGPAIHMTRSEILRETGRCDLAIEDMEKAVLLEKTVEAAVEYRIELIGLLMACLYEERARAEALDLREYIYGSPRPDLEKIRRLDSLIEKGSRDEE